MATLGYSMDTTTIVTIIASSIGALAITLTTVLGWLGSRVVNKLDEVYDKIEVINVEMITRLSALDNRVSILEILRSAL